MTPLPGLHANAITLDRNTCCWQHCCQMVLSAAKTNVYQQLGELRQRQLPTLNAQDLTRGGLTQGEAVHQHQVEVDVNECI